MQDKMMRMTRLRYISLQGATHVLFPRRMSFYGARCFSSKLEDAVREDKLDFITASKILFSTPSKPKKFGIDFHLVQFFFACLPSLAVYLVAQYARYDIRKMEAEVEMKKKLAEEEEQAYQSSELDLPVNSKEVELDDKLSGSAEMSGKGKVETLQELKSRLDTLEETIKRLTSAEREQTSRSVTTEPQGNHGKQPSNQVAAATESKGNANTSSKEEFKNKETSHTDNVEARNVLESKKESREDLPRSNVDSQTTKLRGPNSEVK